MKGVLDREFYSAFNLKIKAFEVQQHSSFSTIELKIGLRDVNDNKPQFKKDSYIVSVTDNWETNKVFADDVKAYDEDATVSLQAYHLNGRIFFLRAENYVKLNFWCLFKGISQNCSKRSDKYLKIGHYEKMILSRPGQQRLKKSPLYI